MLDMESILRLKVGIECIQLPWRKINYAIGDTGKITIIGNEENKVNIPYNIINALEFG